MPSLPQGILNRVRKADAGGVHTPRDFADLGSRAAVDQTLSRMVRAGQLQRVGRRLYYLPRVNPRLGIAVPPDVDRVAAAFARQTGSQVLPSGAAAANQLGLSTQVPAKAVYLTDGRSRHLRAGRLNIQLKHVAPANFHVCHKSSALVFQALRYLGRDAVGDRTLAILRSVLTPAQQRALRDDSRYAPAWVASAVRDLDKRPAMSQTPSHG